MATKNICDAILAINPTAIFKIDGEWEYENIVWVDNTTPISKSDIEAKLSEIQTIEDNKIQADEDLKASAKAKLIAGEKLTEEEANILVGV